MRSITLLLTLITLVIICAIGCAADVTIGTLIPGSNPTRNASVVLHWDTDFTPDERASANEAADIWNRQTGGLAHIENHFDLDFNSIRSLTEHTVERNDNIIIRLESWMDSVKQMEPDDGGKILGWVTSGGIHNPWGQAIHGAFVADRMAVKHVRLMVMLHEFGHLLGLPHSASVQAIMFPHIIANGSACLKQADLVSFCQVNMCGHVKMYPCE